MRRSIAVAGVVVLGLTLTQGVAQAAPTAPVRPKGANPYLALVPDGTKMDFAGWRTYLKSRAATRLRPAATAAAGAIAVDEEEPDGTYGSNDEVATAQQIADFGTADGFSPRIRILGSLDNQTIAMSPIATPAEDNGSIPLASETGIGTFRGGLTTSGTIGDGPYGTTGTGSGDYDFFKVPATRGQVITVTTATPTGPLDTIVQLYSSTGALVAANDDAVGLDSQLTYRVPAAGTYYAVVAGYRGVPLDPFDSSRGNGGGSTGPYNLTVTSGVVDLDYYAVDLRPGDVVGASVAGSATAITVYDTEPREVHGSTQDATYIYPMSSPLPGGGKAATDYVATTAGWHTIGVTKGSGAYNITVEGYRPPLQGAIPAQTLFLDFDGARVNTGIFGGTGNVQLTPFSAFIARWGLTNADRDRLIDEVVATVRENLAGDMVASGLNTRFTLDVRNSRDDADPWGQPNVSRIIVGGTIAESGVETIGIAQSIDPGNFDTEETALVLLDVLSDPAGPDDSLNTYLTEASDRVAFVGRALGNVIAHEGGHFFGDFHTNNLDNDTNLMDAGGTGFPNLFGVGPDDIGGTADDPDVDFGDDRFLPAEGFTGTQDTLGRVAFGLTS